MISDPLSVLVSANAIELRAAQAVGSLEVAIYEQFRVTIEPQLFNFRICISRVGQEGYERGWCYFNRPLQEIVLLAAAFNPDKGEEPVGWVKEAGTGRRPCGSYHRSNGTHATYVADCPDCGNEELE